MGNPELSHKDRLDVEKHTKNMNEQIKNIVREYTKQYANYTKEGNNKDLTVHYNEGVQIKDNACKKIAEAISGYLTNLDAKIEIIYQDNEIKLNIGSLEKFFSENLKEKYTKAKTVELNDLFESLDMTTDVNNKLKENIAEIGKEINESLEKIKNELLERKMDRIMETSSILTIIGEVVASIGKAVSKAISYLISGKDNHKNNTEENKDLENLADNNVPKLEKLCEKLSSAAKEVIKSEVSKSMGA
ncbi:hypothetical protein I862_06580 [endosymbiont of Acanthamoeba sp. UWC8]|uniref:hypothetical protein n=1 Tax=endosymbiont of Acanthamoeba sp. UWC8 TaxID=86106 RepID=UPI0004D1925A|nr:hypothetical protein [endosymbiont of Acanthamoeba sp. UWC8]AIF81870.1 hypothetical protein I862_06580 [endosymbiont of Acanthamoeba sp. UWC8]